MTTSMPWVLIVVSLALLQFIGFGAAVSWARGKYKVAAPATTGNEVFERYFRVQMNTVEQLLVFLPAIWLFASQVNANWAAGLGAVYLVGRLVYFFSYVKDPRSRSLGFALSSLPAIVMLLGVLVMAVIRLLQPSVP